MELKEGLGMEANNKWVNYQARFSHIEGNTVRKPDYAQRALRYNNAVPEKPIREIPEPERRTTVRPERRTTARPEKRTYRQPRYMTSIGKSTMLVLTLAIAATLYCCIEFLKLQYQVNKMEKEIVSLENTLNEMVTENNAAYEQIKTAYDLDYVYNVAVNELGMVYPNNNEIITLKSTDESYVRQYADIPD